MKDIKMYEDLKSYHCIAVVGSGGKTSLIFYLAGLFARQGKRVLITTSTHMWYEPDRPFVEWSREGLDGFAMENTPTIVGIRNLDTGKISCPQNTSFGELLDLCDVLLVEADGSKGKPLKVPAEYEPVIPREADLVMGVVGLDAIGHTTEEVCHRPKDVEKFLAQSERIGNKKSNRSADFENNQSKIITWEDIVEICDSDLGLKKGVGSRGYQVILNKADDEGRRQYGERIRLELYRRNQDRFGVEIMELRRKKIGIILLAAGDSRRFGTANKLLHEVNGKSMFQHTLELMESLNCGSITVVTQYEEIENIARQAGADVYYNPHPQEGISSSIKIGIKATPHAEAWLITVCDQPYMTREILEGLLQLYFQHPDQIAAMSAEGKIVNPSIFPASYGEELLELTGDIGGKHVIVNHRTDTQVYEIQNPEELKDIDRLE